MRGVCLPRAVLLKKRCWVSIVLAAWSVACSQGTPKDHESKFGESGAPLTPGWHLSSVRTADGRSPLSLLPTDCCVLFLTEPVYDGDKKEWTTQNRPVLPSEVLPLGAVYWMYVSQQDRDFESSVSRQPPVLPHRSLGLWFTAARPLPLTELLVDGAYQWDQAQQTMARVSRDGVLRPGMPYWINTNDQCDPGLWAESVTGVVPKACSLLSKPVTSTSSASLAGSAVFEVSAWPAGDNKVTKPVVVAQETYAPVSWTWRETQEAQGPGPVQVFSIAHDRDPPSIVLGDPPHRVVYVSDYVVRGRIEDAHFLSAQLTALDDGREIGIPERGRFAVPVGLRPGLNRLRIDAQDRAGNSQARNIELFYETAPYLASQPSMPPKTVHGWRFERTVHLRWSPPVAFADGQRLPIGVSPRYRIYRDDGHVVEHKGTAYQEDVPELGRAYRYHVTALLRGQEGEHESRPSDRLEISVGFETPVPLPGRFEPAAAVTQGRRSASLPALSFSRFEGITRTHMVYLERGHGGVQDRIRYTQSQAYAKAGTWIDDSEPLIVAPAGHRITDLSVAAHGDQVAVSWIETAKDGRDGRIRALVFRGSGKQATGEKHLAHQSVDLGAGTGLKRDLDTAFDRFGHHHLIWSQSGKVYYAKDFEGSRSAHGTAWNVFDEQKRRVNHELVKYADIVTAACTDSTGCCTETNEDAYSLGVESRQDPKCSSQEGCEREYGAYLERTEETYVESPSLYVGPKSITIAARQTRMFDNLPRANSAWGGLRSSFLGPSVPPPSWQHCEGRGHQWDFGGTKRFRKGFLHARLRDQYACALPVPQNRLELLQLEEQYKSIQDFGDDLHRYYAYDGDQGHPLEWYQYTHAGVWHEEDQIKIAQRPLDEGAWSELRSERRAVPRLTLGPGARVVLEETIEDVEHGFRRGAWRRAPVSSQAGASHVEGAEPWEETFLRWRISTVDRFPSERAGEVALCGSQELKPDQGPVGPSHAKVFADLRDPNRMFAVYEKGPSENPNDQGFNPIQLAHSEDGGLTWSLRARPLAMGYMPSVRVSSEGELGVLYYAPDPVHRTEDKKPLGQILLARSKNGGETFGHEVLNKTFDASSGQEQMVPAQPIHWVTHGTGAAVYDGVPAFAAHQDLWVVAFVRHRDHSSRQNQIMTTRASFPPQEEKRAVVSGPARVAQNQSFEAEIACENQYQMAAKGCALQSASLAYGTGVSVSIDASLAPEGRLDGSKTLWLPGIAGLGGSEQPVHLSLQSQETTLGRDTLLVGANRPQENYYKAKVLRDRLFSGELALQREYEDDETEAHDAKFLSSFDRVWAYTQGIALAQLTKEGDPRSTALADRLCSQGIAVRGQNAQGVPVIKGWHFSWNTHEDTWKDVRLVTGATAWVIHGLGVYLSSKEAGARPPEERALLQACYLAGLGGLFEHRAQELASDPLAQWLMTAGTTVEGLKYAERIDSIGLSDSRVGLVDDNPEVRRWAYYDILDVVGYDSLNFDAEPKISTFYRDEQDLPISTRDLTLGLKNTWILSALKKEARAENVVTEHNLDTLSVLNHAIQHWDEMLAGLAPSDLRGRIQHAEIVFWRDRLRDAIFQLLWDPVEERVVTGGVFDDDGRFERSSLSAVDNCSWLSLSADLGALGDEEQSKLARCLHYTVDRFTREKLEYNGAEYYGAFYFPNSFKDPYVAVSDKQEELYHLEATAGLILGLLRFSEAYGASAVEDAATFRAQAARLWSDMQRFVHDGGENGFPYSTVRIQDVMARLPSATAAIWFIDVYDHYAAHVWDLDGSLGLYTHAANDVDGPYPLSTVRDQTRELWSSLEARSPRGDERSTSASGLWVLSPGPNPSAAPVAYLEDQALAIVAAVNYGEREVAGRWVEGLLQAVTRSPRSSRVDVPFAVEPKTGQSVMPYLETRTQLLAAYALGWFAQDEPDTTRGREIIEVMHTILESTTEHYRNPQGLFLSGAGAFLPSPAPGDHDLTALSEWFPIATIEDHVIAYFALRLAARLHESALLSRRASEVAEILHGWFWEPGDAPLVEADASGWPRGRLSRVGGFDHVEDPPGASAFYLLFASEAGHTERASRSLDVLAGLPVEPPDGSVGDACLLVDDAFVLLGKRAGARLDPRLEELAWNDYHRALDACLGTDVPDLRAGHYAAWLIAQNPRGFFGVEAEPMVGIGPLPTVDDLRPSDQRLTRSYTQAVTSLVTDGIRPYAFDANLRTLVGVEFVAEAVAEAWPLESWPARFQQTRDVRLRLVVSKLLRFCDADVSRLASGVLSGRAVGATIGLDCDSVSAKFGEALRLRVGTEKSDDLVAVMAHPNDAFELLALVGDVFYQKAPAQEPTYVALGLKEGLSQGQRAENIRQLRRLINLEAAGHLPKAAHQSGLSADEVQRMMRTGEIQRRDFEHLATGLSLGTDDRAFWSTHFQLLDGAPWPWPETPVRTGPLWATVHAEQRTLDARVGHPQSVAFDPELHLGKTGIGAGNAPIVFRPDAAPLDRVLWGDGIGPLGLAFGEAGSLMPNDLSLAEGTELRIPPWIREIALWWAEDQADEATFINALQHLIRERILVVPPPVNVVSDHSEVPAWVKDNVRWWATEQIDDDEFLQSIQYLAKVGILDLGQSVETNDTHEEAGLAGEVVFEGRRGSHYGVETRHLSGGRSKASIDWVAHYSSGWLRVEPPRGTAVDGELHLGFSVDPDVSFLMEARDEPYRDLVKIVDTEGNELVRFRVLLHQKPMAEVVFDGWQDGIYGVLAFPMSSSVFTEKWTTSWVDGHVFTVEPKSGPSATADVKMRFRVDKRLGQELPPQSRPYEDILSVFAADGMRVGAFRVLLHQRGVVDRDAEGFHIPPGLAWCVPGDVVPTADETQCHTAKAQADFCPDAGCRDGVSPKVRWSLNGRPFSGFGPKAAFNILEPGEVPQVFRDTHEVAVKKERGETFSSSGIRLREEDVELRYVGERDQGLHGDLTMVLPQSFVGRMGSVLETTASLFAEVASLEADFLGLDDVPRYRAFILPEALYVASAEGLWSANDANVLDTQALASGEYLIFSWSTDKDFEDLTKSMTDAFAHEYVHRMMDAVPKLRAKIPHDTGGSRLCLEEGLAELLSAFFERAKWEDLDPLTYQEVFEGRSAVSRTCSENTEDVGDWLKGVCVMWHLYERGHFEGETGRQFIRSLFRPAREIAFDTCALDDLTTGNGLVVYLTEAWSEAKGEFESLAGAVDAMGIDHSGSYEDALDWLGYAPSDGIWTQAGVGSAGSNETLISFDDTGACSEPTVVSVQDAAERIEAGDHHLSFRSADGCYDDDWVLTRSTLAPGDGWSHVRFGGLQILSFAQRTRRLSKIIPLLTKPTDDWLAAMTAAGSIIVAELAMPEDRAIIDRQALQWNRLRLFQRPPENDARWRFLGAVYGLDAILTPEVDLVQLPIWSPSADGLWRPTGSFSEHGLYAIVQPKEFQGVPVLDPLLPVFPLAEVHRESENAWLPVYERVGPVSLMPESGLSPRTPSSEPFTSPQEPRTRVYPGWITELFPPELWWSVYYTNFIEPELRASSFRGPRPPALGRLPAYQRVNDVLLRWEHPTSGHLLSQPTLWPAEAVDPGHIQLSYVDSDGGPPRYAKGSKKVVSDFWKHHATSAGGQPEPDPSLTENTDESSGQTETSEDKPEGEQQSVPVGSGLSILDGLLAPLPRKGTAYYGFGLDAVQAARKNVPKRIFVVSPKGKASPKRASSSKEFILATVDPSFANGEDPLVSEARSEGHGQAVVTAQETPPNAMRLKDLYDALGLAVPSGSENYILVPLPLREGIGGLEWSFSFWSTHHQNREWPTVDGDASYGQVRVVPYVDDRPMTDGELKKNATWMRQWLKGTVEHKDHWTARTYDRARLNTRAIVYRADPRSPLKPGGAFYRVLEPFSPETAHDEDDYEPYGYVHASDTPKAGLEYVDLGFQNWKTKTIWLLLIRNDGRGLHLKSGGMSGDDGEVGFAYLRPSQIIGAEEYYQKGEEGEPVLRRYHPNPNYVADETIVVNDMKEGFAFSDEGAWFGVDEPHDGHLLRAKRLAFEDKSTLVLVHNPKHGFAMIPLYETGGRSSALHPTWATIKATWQGDTTVLSMTGLKNQVEEHRAVSMLFTQTNQKYVRVLKTLAGNTQVRYYNRALNYGPGEWKLSPKPQTAYRDGLSQIGKSFFVSSHKALSEKDFGRLDWEDFGYEGHALFSDARLLEIKRNVFPRKAVIQILLTEPYDDDDVLVFSLDNKAMFEDDRAPLNQIPDGTFLVLSMTGASTPARERENVKKLFAHLQAHGVDQHFVRVIKEDHVLWYSEDLEVIGRESNLHKNPQTAVREAIDKLASD